MRTSCSANIRGHRFCLPSLINVYPTPTSMERCRRNLCSRFMVHFGGQDPHSSYQMLCMGAGNCCHPCHVEASYLNTSPAKRSYTRGAVDCVLLHMKDLAPLKRSQSTTMWLAHTLICIKKIVYSPCCQRAPCNAPGSLLTRARRTIVLISQIQNHVFHR